MLSEGDKRGGCLFRDKLKGCLPLPAKRNCWNTFFDVFSDNISFGQGEGQRILEGFVQLISRKDILALRSSTHSEIIHFNTYSAMR